MIWTIVAVMAVLATKFVTALRLKDLKAKLEAVQPYIDDLKVKLGQAEDDYQNLKLKEEATQTRLTHLRGVVVYLENQVKSAPTDSSLPDERAQVLQAAEAAAER